MNRRTNKKGKKEECITLLTLKANIKSFLKKLV